MEEQIVDILATLQSSIETMAPAAWNALVTAVRIEAIRNLIAFPIGISWILIYTIKLPKVVKIYDDYQGADSAKVTATMFLVLGAIGCLISVIAVLDVGLDSRTILGLFSPEAQVIRDLLTKIS